MTPEQERRAFERLHERLGEKELERRLKTLPSYRAYLRRYGRMRIQVVSLDDYLERHQIADTTPSLEDEAIAKDNVRQFAKTLSPKQRKVMDSLSLGHSSAEVAQQQHLKSTGGVRYYRHVLRKKFKRL